LKISIGIEKYKNPTNLVSNFKIMKFFIVTDLEGVAGVSKWSQTRENNNVNKLPAMKLLTEEVNAAIRGILQIYPKAEIHVFDGHGYMGMDTTVLHERAKVWLGSNTDPYCGLDDSYNAILFIGQHAMAGVEGAPLNHTYSSLSVVSFELNGKPIGEFGCRAALGASIGVPTIFLSGDDKAVNEATSTIPEIFTVTTKWGKKVEWALHRNPIETRKLIQSGARAACKKMKKIPLYLIKPPYELLVTLTSPDLTESWTERGGLKVADNKVLFKAQKLDQLPI
jgi:D-amino peptidase